MLKVVAEQIEQVKSEIAAAEAVYRGGRGSQADVIGAYGTLAALEDKASELRRRVLVGTTNLGRLDGRGRRRAARGSAGHGDGAPRRGNPGPGSLHHPEIAVLAKQEEIAVAEAKDSAGEQHSGLERGGSVSAARAAVFEHGLGRLSVPLPWDRANRQDREIAFEARDGRAGARAEGGNAAGTCRRAKGNARRVAERARAPRALQEGPSAARRGAQQGGACGLPGWQDGHHRSAARTGNETDMQIIVR